MRFLASAVLCVLGVSLHLVDGGHRRASFGAAVGSETRASASPSSGPHSGGRAHTVRSARSGTPEKVSGDTGVLYRWRDARGTIYIASERPSTGAAIDGSVQVYLFTRATAVDSVFRPPAEMPTGKWRPLLQSIVGAEGMVGVVGQVGDSLDQLDARNGLVEQLIRQL